MTKALFVVVPVLALVVSSGTAVATHSALAIDEATGVINGAAYAMFVPPAWNGRLILYAHGFVDPDAPIALPDAAPADVAPWVVQLRETLLGAGYAVAYSSYAENGWAVKDGAARTHELRDLFSSRFGAPTHVYVMGRSLGGLITVFHERAYAKIVAAARTSTWLAQQSVQRYGHCNVTPSDEATPLSRLRSRTQNGQQPAIVDRTLNLPMSSSV